MKKVYFIFFCCLLLTITVLNGTGAIDFSFQVLISLSLVALVGIPHGAMDHIIYLKKSKTGPFVFYGFYLSLIGIYATLWVFFPALSFVLFLLLSAFHFGQSQFADIPIKRIFLKYLLYFFWGTSILAGMLTYRFEEIMALSVTSVDMQSIISVFREEVFLIFLVSGTLVTLALLPYLVIIKAIKIQRLFVELFVLAIIHVSFYSLPVLLGFTLYFVILHSLRVLMEEYTFVLSYNKKATIYKFISLLLPFTLLSLVGGTVLFFLSDFGFIEVSNTLLLFGLIAALTLPHSIVMDKFYAK